jgi:sulfite reductase beta subunit-like hemoprotein
MNDVERIKKEKGGLEVWNDLQRIAIEGYAGIDADDMFRLRWLGLYEQKPKDGFFMLRIKVPGGQLNHDQLIAVAEVTRDYARNIADITTRQNFQFHWMAPADFPAIFAKFSAVGISTLGACGDIPRNVTGCPVAGLDPNEIFDAQP